MWRGRWARVGVEPSGLATGDPRTVFAMHRRALKGLRGPILGVPDSRPDDVFANTRLIQILNALVKSRGAVAADSPGFPKLTPMEYSTLARTFMDAVKLGVGEDVVHKLDRNRWSYLLENKIEGKITGPEFVDQRPVYDQIVGTANTDLDLSNPTTLAKALHEVAKQQFLAMIAISNPGGFDPRPGLQAVSQLANLMDEQGVTFKSPDIVEELGKSAKNLGRKAGDLLLDALPYVLGAVGGIQLLVGVASRSTVTVTSGK